MDKTAVTAICWIPKGKCHPRRPQADGGTPEQGGAKDDDAEMDGGGGASSSSAVPKQKNHLTDGIEEFDLENYDADDDNQGMNLFAVLENDMPLVHKKDPNMQGDPDSESEEGCDEIGDEDKIFMAVSVEEDQCQMELYVYDEDEASMYVHHDVMLDAYPLCCEWLSGATGGKPGSFAAIGLIDHSIHIWDLEEMDPVEPAGALGKNKKDPKGKKKKGPVSTAIGAKAHDGAVLCLHSSAFNRSVLASGSADETLKVWDVNENKCVHQYKHHTGKVQCARWHPTEQAVLLSAAFDGKLGLLDVRQPNQAALAELPAEAECAIWSRHAPFECLVSVDNGGVACYDVRKIVSKDTEKMRLYNLDAHDVACTAITDAPAKNLLVTTGLDGVAKVWKTDGLQPMMVFSKDLKAGPVFTCQSSPEAEALMCFGGKCTVMWDLSSESVLCGAFNLTPATPAEPLMGSS